MYDTTLIVTQLERPYRISQDEHDRALHSLRENGIAVLRGFMPTDDAKTLYQDADSATSPNFVYGYAGNLKAACETTNVSNEFRHPFLISDLANRVVTSPDLQEMIASYLEERPVIHHALFQRTFPRTVPAVDWHVDCGSNKTLNGKTQYTDRRLRSILYLTDVENGGLAYICDSANEATPLFLSLPPSTLFPSDKVPADLTRRVSCHEKAGTLILFDTFGLHRPDPLKDERMVLNVWFARKDFSGNLPPALFSLARVPENQRAYLDIFNNERRHNPVELSQQIAETLPAANASLMKRVLRRVF